MVQDETLAGRGGRARRWHGVAWFGGMVAALVAGLFVSVALASPPGPVALADVPRAVGAATGAAGAPSGAGGVTGAEAPAPSTTPTRTTPGPADPDLPAVVATATPGDPRLDAALALVDFPWRERLVGWQVAFLPRDEAYYGMTLVEDRRIEVYVRDEQAPADIAGVLAHELGHAVDVTLLCWGDRYDWLTSRGQAPTARWYVEDGASDFESGAGDFAEAFAVWQVGRQTWSRLAGAPTAAQLAQLAELATTAAPADGRC